MWFRGNMLVVDLRDLDEGWMFLYVIAYGLCTNIMVVLTSRSIIGLVVEFIVAIDEARVRFTDDAQQFLFLCFVVFGFSCLLVF